MLELTNIEAMMFAKGYVSAKMIAAKTNRHHVSVRKDVRQHPDSFESMHHGRWLRFFSIKSVAKFYKSMFPMIDFFNWNDVIEGDEPTKKKRAAR